MKIMHETVTKFCSDMSKILDAIIERENAKQTYLSHRSASKAVMESTENISSEAYEIDVDQPHNDIQFQNVGLDDDLSDSEIEIGRLTTCTTIKYKNITYRTQKTKATDNLDIPDGIYRCTRLKKKCTGTVEPIAKSNGKVHIRPVNAHSC